MARSKSENHHVKAKISNDQHHPGTTPQNSSNYNSKSVSNEVGSFKCPDNSRYTSHLSHDYRPYGDPEEVDDEIDEISDPDHQDLDQDENKENRLIDDALDKILTGSKMDSYNTAAIVTLSDLGRLEKIPMTTNNRRHRRGKAKVPTGTTTIINTTTDTKKEKNNPETKQPTNATEQTQKQKPITQKENNPENNDQEIRLQEQPENNQKTHTSKKNKKWGHDRFDDQKQKPKTNEDLVNEYGYDIRDNSHKQSEKLALNTEPSLRKGSRNARRRRGREREERLRKEKEELSTSTLQNKPETTEKKDAPVEEQKHEEKKEETKPTPKETKISEKTPTENKTEPEPKKETRKERRKRLEKERRQRNQIERKERSLLEKAEKAKEAEKKVAAGMATPRNSGENSTVKAGDVQENWLGA